MSTALTITNPTPLLAVRQVDGDADLVRTWLGRHESKHKRDNYARQARRFMAYVAS